MQQAPLNSISIHALFAEGDTFDHEVSSQIVQFLSTPSSQRATITSAAVSTYWSFLSTPSSQRATRFLLRRQVLVVISIHALFAEGDIGVIQHSPCHAHFYPRPLRRGRLCLSPRAFFPANFYPRPLRRGRPLMYRASGSQPSGFLSTPSSQRATAYRAILQPSRSYFYPRPLRRGRRCSAVAIRRTRTFLSTPSSQRATLAKRRGGRGFCISIHALFAEGDRQLPQRRALRIAISIHALFAEGDLVVVRHQPHVRISIHALFAEGDRR